MVVISKKKCKYTNPFESEYAEFILILTCCYYEKKSVIVRKAESIFDLELMREHLEVLSCTIQKNQRDVEEQTRLRTTSQIGLVCQGALSARRACLAVNVRLEKGCCVHGRQNSQQKVNPRQRAGFLRTSSK